MHDNFEDLMALHDGERSENVVSDNPVEDETSREMLSRLAAADHAFKSAADELLDMPVPTRLIDAIQNANNGNDSTPGLTPKGEKPHSAQIISFPKRRGLVAFATAAGLAAILVTNTDFLQSPEDAVRDYDSAAFANLLQNTLELTASGDINASADGALRIIPMATFRAGTAGYCREFMGRDQQTERSGIACRSAGGSWEIRSQRAVQIGTTGDAFQAAEGLASNHELNDSLDLGEALSYSQEQTIIQERWGVTKH